MSYKYNCNKRCNYFYRENQRKKKFQVNILDTTVLVKMSQV